MKTCFKCNATLPYSEFYRHPAMGDGYLGKCKECTKKDARKNREKNISYYREYDLKRAKTEKRKKAREEYKTRDWYKESQKKRMIRYREKYMEKYVAHTMVSNGLKYGKIKKEPCEICGETKVHAHHDDYSKPLEIRWLCEPHHREWHKEHK